MGAFVIAVLEDNPDRVAEMRRWLGERFEGYETFFTDDPDTLIGYLAGRPGAVLAVSLDHDLHERPDMSTEVTGMQVVDYLVTQPPRFPVVVHSSNRPAVARMRRRLTRKNWGVSVVVPFDDTAWIGDDW